MNTGADKSSIDKPFESGATGVEGSDDDSYDELDARLPAALSEKPAAREGDSKEPDKYAKIRREKRLAMNRESARNRRKQKQFLIKSLEDQVESLRKLNQQHQINIESMTSKNRTLENELTAARITIAQLSDPGSSTATGIAVPLQHQSFGNSLFSSQLQNMSSPSFPSSLEPQSTYLQQQQLLQQQLHQQQQQQHEMQISTSGRGIQQLFDSVFSSQAPTSVTTVVGQISGNIGSADITGRSYSLQPANSLQPNGAGTRSLSSEVTVGTNQQISSAIGTGSSTVDLGDNLSRLLQAQRDRHTTTQHGATIAASMFAPATVGSPMFAPSWDVPTSMDDSLLGTMNISSTTMAPWQSAQGNTMRQIETDATVRGNLDIDDRQNQIALDPFSPSSTFETITRSNPNEISGMGGYSSYHQHQQKTLEDIAQQRKIDDFFRYRNGKDQDPQSMPSQQPQMPQLAQLHQQQYQHQQLQLQLQQQQSIQQQQQLMQQQLLKQQQQGQPIQPGQVSHNQSGYDDTLKSDAG